MDVVRLIDKTSIDLIDISGGTYFPGAESSSEGSKEGPYFIDFAKLAKEITEIPLMVTGGFKRKDQAVNAIASGAVDIISMGRAMAINPKLAKTWLSGEDYDPVFPRFKDVIPGGITAWYTMRLIALGEDKENDFELDLPTAIQKYEQRDAQRCGRWLKKFSSLNS